MFTGITESVGTINKSTSVPGGRRLAVSADAFAGQCALGASVMVSGVCLTVSAVADNTLEFDVITETLDKSSLGSKRVGSRVNLERGMCIGDRIDGHFVQGHIDGTGIIERLQSSARQWVVWIKPQPHLSPYMIPKGSVALDGVSLTIAQVRGGNFSVALIPTTLERTTLASLSTGDLVNIESDIIARTIVHRLSGMSAGGSLTVEGLREAGFA